MPHSPDRKRWNIYVKPSTPGKVKALALAAGDKNIGAYLDELIEKLSAGAILVGGEGDPDDK